MEIAFWLGVTYLAYVEIGYVLLLFVLSKLKRQKFHADEEYPSDLTILIAAHNEETVIRQKLENTLSQDYPKERVQIIVASDASTDRTDQIVEEYKGQGVVLCRTEQHRGKIAALRDAERSISGQVVVFTDADAILQPQAIRKLTRHFADPKVGAVSGREVRPAVGALGKGKGEGLYNRIETQVKELEGKVGNQVLLHGGIFAMRRELMMFVPDHLTHDGVVPAMLTLQGYKTLYEPEAISIESYDLDTGQDWQRRIRTVMQALQSYLYVKEALKPWKTGFYAVQIWSHRMLRWFVFPVLMLVLVSNVILAGKSALYAGLFIGQAICYVWAGVGFWLDRMGNRRTVFYYPFYFMYIHMAAFYAVLLAWKGERFTTWQPAERKISSR